ncbi:MAG: hypothetical protein A2V92_05890 [Candidatus Muproteobacteria bacterium RBG_16_65_31]|uniref:histidine kinase n=1 Tax=Candidatus Muproteobacteria bacterium RBG_16_65_31 TaxID=1817759 RepID=A0A1F6THN6_9PROT|nr:MAG: hypothetical protein A2V92_05890 [Candidatus Muproteobacteria bacterium RBG_16_65_31]
MKPGTLLQRLHPRRLHVRIAALGALLLAAVVAIYTWDTIRTRTATETAALLARAQALAEQTAYAGAAPLVTRHYSDVEALLLRFARMPEVLRIQVLNREGRIVSDIVREDGGAPHIQFDAPAVRPPAGGELVVQGGAERYVVWRPIEAGDRVGWVRLEYSTRAIAEMRAQILRSGLFTALVSIALSAALFALFLRRPMRAVERATDFAARLAENRGTTYPVERNSYEVEQLGTALNQVSLKLAEQEQALHTAHRRLQAVLQHAIDGIVTLDAQGRIESANPAAEKIFGLSAEQILGRAFGELVPYFRMDDFEQENLHHIEVGGRRHDGAAIPLMLGLSRMDLEGRRRYVGILRDISEQKRLDRMKSNFVSSVSHELRTPLTSIHAALCLLAGGEVDGIGGEAKDLAALAYKNSTRLARIINDILDFESIEAGRVVLAARAVALAPLIEEAVREAGDLARARTVRLALALEAPGAQALADAPMLKRALAQLLTNAIRLSPPREEVHVALSRREGFARIAVTDRGPGIPESARKYIFQKFVQVDAGDIRYKEGTGLGLALARTIVERLGGSIGFDSTPHVATTFFLELPEHRAEEARVA